MAIFSNFFVNINTHIIRCNAGEKIKSIFELFTKQKIGFRFVLFLSVQTLVPVKSKVEILQNFVAFSDYMNSKSLGNSRPQITGNRIIVSSRMNIMNIDFNK